ncbi:unnamed protein product [marine sediment metagenome]|uniref:Uncharacterized protein n=1 Tax=marine sediment metagenome TaxID=412755 RepID=X1RKD3_9ZZZZ
MIVKVNCPIAGCGTQVQVQSLPKHLEKVHELDGELVLRLHPTATYQHTPADDQEPEEEAEPEKEPEPEQEPEPEKEPETEPEE